MPNCSIFKRHTARGFTLVELLIVVIILAILAAIVVPQFSATTDDAKAAAADSTLSNLRSAIDFYYQQHGAYPGEKAATAAACTGGTAGTGAVNSAAALQEQLSLYTDMNGGACSVSDPTNFKYGPYMKKSTFPPDPFTNNSAIAVVSAGDLNMTGTSTTGGWKYDTKTGKLIINHTDYDDR